jgi:hypothetical protein
MTLEHKMDNIPSQLNEDGNDQIHERLLKFEETLANKVINLGEQISDKMAKSGSNVEEKLETYAEKVTKNIKESNSQLQAINEINQNVEGLKTDLKTKFDHDEENKLEQRLVASKQMNICIFKLPEANLSDDKKDLIDDVKKLKEIFQNKVSLEKNDVKEIYRIGRKDKSNSRPVIIKLTSVEKKFELLKQTELYYGKERIFIAPDRTRKQQTDHKKLVAELKKRRLDGEDGLMIRNGKISKSQPLVRLLPDECSW